MIGALRAFWSGVQAAVRAIRRNSLRAGLTVLGMMIGVLAVVTVTALGSGARTRVSAQLQSIGSNVLFIFPQSSNSSGARGAQGAGARLTEEDGRTIAREAVSVKLLAPSLRTTAQVIQANQNAPTSVTGTTRPYFEIRNWQIRRGSLWSENDELFKTRVCVLGNTVAEKLFGLEDPVGKYIKIGRYMFRVLGVLETKGEGPFGDDQDDTVIMPISSMRARVMHTSPGFAGILMVSSTSAETTDRAVDQIDSILRERHRVAPDREPDFAIRTQKEFQQMQEAIYTLLTVLLIVIAAISLVVGGIGVMNIMLVSVTERTREIGIRMAIGARENDIRTQFLVEAVILASLGGITGAALGFFAIHALGSALSWPMSLSPVALFVSIATSALTGIVFGFFPARRAARLDPIVALHRE